MASCLISKRIKRKVITINQSIPTNGCAAVTISAETSGLAETLEKLMADVAAVDGVVRVEVLAG